MDIGKTLMNPWVIGGGILAGVLLMTLKSPVSSGGNATPDTSGMYAYATATGAQQVQQNVSLAGITAQDEASFRSLLVTSMAAGYNYDTAVATLQAGITNNMITTSASLQQDRQDNATRINLTNTNAQTSVDLAGINGQTAVTVANVNATAQERVAKTQATGSIIGKVVGAIASFF